MCEGHFHVPGSGLSLVRWLTPCHCPVCGTPTEREGVCAYCDAALDAAQLSRTAFEAVPDRNVFSCRQIPAKLPCAAVFSYEYEAVRKFLFFLKQHPDSAAFRYAALRLAKVLHRFEGGGRTFYVHVPRSFAGKRTYGFDQGALLARAAADLTPDAVFVPCLARRRPAKPQKELSAEERVRNQCGAFRMRMFYPLPAKEPERIVIIDDVITTGASALACAGVLRSRYPNARLYGAFLAHTHSAPHSYHA